MIIYVNADKRGLLFPYINFNMFLIGERARLDSCEPKSDTLMLVM